MTEQATATRGHRAAPQLLIGIAGTGVVHTDADNFDVRTRFRMVKESGVFDYYDKTPPTGELDIYLRASRAYGLPLRAGGFRYTLGRDEPLLAWHLRMARETATLAHNIQIPAYDADGRPVTDQEVADAFCNAAEIGDRNGVAPCLEPHIDMWSEHFGRVERVGQLVERRGIAFNITLDPSHVIFKIDNPAEQAVQDMRGDIEAGHLILDPRVPGNVISHWIRAGWVRHCHARPAVPANPANTRARHPDGRPGRGVQYPFRRPPPGGWHAEWHEAALDAWKTAIRDLLAYHASEPESRLGQISTELLPGIDYGAGATYSLFDDAVACAQWIREQWEATNETANPTPGPAPR
jgi:hypothetical protein